MPAVQPVTRKSVREALIAQQIERAAVVAALGGEFEFDSDGRLKRIEQERKSRER